jgi:hypothetical protein
MIFYMRRAPGARAFPTPKAEASRGHAIVKVATGLTSGIISGMASGRVHRQRLDRAERSAYYSWSFLAGELLAKLLAEARAAIVI